ncbi:cupin domain-containing protein [Halomicrobium salinisoli]|uniref:cupin domain-containing protein n=1 Tax=Halomicrobium salinisoli TaxID=2878391 RepID=UPI003B832064
MPSKINYEDVDPVADGLHFLREPLDAENLGVSVLDVPADWSGKPHDHADEGQEEVYVLIEGSATVTVEDETVEMEPGDALRLAPEETRAIETDEESTFVLAGAP